MTNIEQQIPITPLPIGQKLTEQQKDNAKENAIAKTIKGSYKFQDNGVFIVASSKSDMIIGLYKEDTTATQQDIKIWLVS